MVLVEKKIYIGGENVHFLSQRTQLVAQIDYHIVGSGDLIYRGLACISHYWSSLGLIFSPQFVILISMPCRENRVRVQNFIFSILIRFRINLLLILNMRSPIPTQQANMATSPKSNGFFREKIIIFQTKTFVSDHDKYIHKILCAKNGGEA